jgi:hypothetical protein
VAGKTNVTLHGKHYRPALNRWLPFDTQSPMCLSCIIEVIHVGVASLHIGIVDATSTMRGSVVPSTMAKWVNSRDELQSPIFVLRTKSTTRFMTSTKRAYFGRNSASGAARLDSQIPETGGPKQD